SCCLYPTDTTTLEEAETFALAETLTHAAIADGMSILELGCGWGSLSIYLATHFPNSRVTSVANSASQREDILARAETLGV
ncbi:SAM-dependent methyltransferase, partial [Rhizobium johnstonii]|uniref:SAM-dependent methyltransferase n=1 Tax=Rhizobium johnstonii TaxID=3019933 RepID=UPI003F996E16